MSAPTNHAFAPVHVKSPLHVAVPSDVDLDDVLAALQAARAAEQLAELEGRGA